MAQQFVLVHKESGQEFVFSSRAEYINTKAQGGYRDKPQESREQVARDQPRVVQPMQRRPEQPAPAAAPTPKPAEGPQPADKPVQPEQPHA